MQQNDILPQRFREDIHAVVSAGYYNENKTKQNKTKVKECLSKHELVFLSNLACVALRHQTKVNTTHGITFNRALR